MKIDCIIVAGGSGTRLGASLPKAFVPLGTKPLFVHSLLKIDSYPAINKIVIVVPSSMIDETRDLLQSFPLKNNLSIVAGGKERWQSVENGLNVCQSEWIMVHDSARPFVTTKILDDICILSHKYEAVITAIPEIDTIRKFKGDLACETLERNEIIRVQTPQLFKKELLFNGFTLAKTLKNPPTDESMLMEHLGISVGISWGDPRNFKVTTPEDMIIAEALLAKQS